VKKLPTTQKAFFPIASCLFPSFLATLREQKSKRIPIAWKAIDHKTIQAIHKFLKLFVYNSRLRAFQKRKAHFD
jgi:hypothetical protein